jgi:hypothetical protein
MERRSLSCADRAPESVFSNETNISTERTREPVRERLSNALHIVLTVSKEDLLKKEALMKRAREKKRVKKPS